MQNHSSSKHFSRVLAQSTDTRTRIVLRNYVDKTKKLTHSRSRANAAVTLHGSVRFQMLLKPVSQLQLVVEIILSWSVLFSSARL